MSSEESDIENTKNCVECGSDIPIAAIKCANCGSFQDWRRHIYFGQAALAFMLSLVAIVSVISANSSSIVDKISSKLNESPIDIQLGVVDVDQNTAQIIATSFHDQTVRS